MLEDRGYDVINDGVNNLDEFMVKYKYRHELALSGVKRNTDQTIVINFEYKKENDKITIQNLLTYAAKIYDMNIYHGIYVSQGTLTNTSKDKLNEMAEKNFLLSFLMKMI